MQWSLAVEALDLVSTFVCSKFSPLSQQRALPAAMAQRWSGQLPLSKNAHRIAC
jgi:hypothetical protein